MNKEIYEVPKIEIILMECEDVITTSGDNEISGDGGTDNPFG